MGLAATVLLMVLLVLLSVLLGVAGVALIQRLMPVERREPYNSEIGVLFGALYVLFGVMIGFTSYLALNTYNTARTTVQSEAADVATIYKLAQQLPEAKREEIQGLAESYARVVVEEEWPRMRQDRPSPRAQALADGLRIAIQEFRPATNSEQAIYAQELIAMNDLDKERATRLLDARPHLPPILWIALAGLSMNILLFSCLVGLEDTRLHMLGVSALSAGITVVFITIVVLDRPFGTEFRLGPQPLESVLHTIHTRENEPASGTEKILKASQPGREPARALISPLLSPT